MTVAPEISRGGHDVLTMTPKALAVVRKVTANPKLDESSGLRIAHSNGKVAPLQVHTATGPRPGDEVVERDGARIFLGREAARQVRGRLLDAVTERNGRVHFVLLKARR
jgi:Fe-S cluster assembly iron-binding protein IscA